MAYNFIENTANGIVYNYCCKEICISEFEVCAGISVKTSTIETHLYDWWIVTYGEATSLLNANRIATSCSDDMYTVFGEGENMMLCAECLCAFHTACLGLLSISKSFLCCSSCSDELMLLGKVIADGNSTPGKSVVLRLKRVVKMLEFEIGTCAICREHDYSFGTFNTWTILLYDQGEEFHVGCLSEKGLCDLMEIPRTSNLLWWWEDLYGPFRICFSWTGNSFTHIINRKHIEKGLLVGRARNDVPWWILSGKTMCPVDLCFLLKVAAIF